MSTVELVQQMTEEAFKRLWGRGGARAFQFFRDGGGLGGQAACDQDEAARGGVGFDLRHFKPVKSEFVRKPES